MFGDGLSGGNTDCVSLWHSCVCVCCSRQWLAGVRGVELHAGFLFAGRPPTRKSVPPEDHTWKQHSLGGSGLHHGTWYVCWPAVESPVCRWRRQVCAGVLKTRGSSGSWHLPAVNKGHCHKLKSGSTWGKIIMKDFLVLFSICVHSVFSAVRDAQWIRHPRLVDWTHQRHRAAAADSAHPLPHQAQQGRQIRRYDKNNTLMYTTWHAHRHVNYTVSLQPSVFDAEVFFLQWRTKKTRRWTLKLGRWKTRPLESTGGSLLNPGRTRHPILILKPTNCAKAWLGHHIRKVNGFWPLSRIKNEGIKVFVEISELPQQAEPGRLSPAGWAQQAEPSRGRHVVNGIESNWPQVHLQLFIAN